MIYKHFVRAVAIAAAIALVPAAIAVADSDSPPPTSQSAKGPRSARSPKAAAVSTAGPAAGTVYVANELSGTVSVIDAATNTLTGTICLGSDPAVPGTPQPAGPCNAEADHHKPFYDGHVAPHGLWLTPDGAILLVANRISGTVVAIDTATNAVLGYQPVGREPHLATVRPGGREAWVAVRGENYLDVLQLDRNDLFDPDLGPTERMRPAGRVKTMAGPSMVTFTSNGKHGFVVHGKAPVVQKVDADSRQVIASQAMPAPFTPFGLVTPDDQELFVVHKAAGTISVLRTDDLSYVVQGLAVGPRANHVAFVGKLAYVTVGGPAPSATNPDPEGKIVVVDRTTHAIVRQWTGPAWTGDPHGIWATPDGRRLFVGHERGNRVTAIDTGEPDDPADDAVVGPATGSSADLAYVKQPIDVVIKP